jgi:hypothetical protein
VKRTGGFLFARLMLVVLLPYMSIFYSFRTTTTTSDASAVKAMFIYNFTKYFDWSEQNSKNEFVIAVYGNSEVTKFLREIAKRKDVNGKSILIKVISSEQEAVGASMIFLPEHSGHILHSISTNPKFKSMLIITDEPGSIKKGAHINLVNVGGKMKFEMNESLLKNNGVIYSKEISSLAVRLY